MRGASCVGSSSRALYRVFVHPAESRELTATTRRQLSYAAALRPSTPASPLTAGRGFATSQARLFTQSSALAAYVARPPHAPGGGPPHRRGTRPPRRREDRDGQRNDGNERFFDEDLGFDKRFTTAKSLERSGRSRLPRDFEITDPQILVLEPGADEPTGPLTPRKALASLQENESLHMISPFIPANKQEETPAKYPVCKIVDKETALREEREERMRRKKADAQARASRPKEIEVAWAIELGDLQTKMRQMGGFLDKGATVEVVLGHKKKKKGWAKKMRQLAQKGGGGGGGGSRLDEGQEEQLVKRVREEIEARGGKESKKPTGEVGETLRIFVTKKE